MPVSAVIISLGQNCFDDHYPGLVMLSDSHLQEVSVVNQKKWLIILGIVLYFGLLDTALPAANCLLTENFDHSVLDSRLVVYDKYWKALTPPQYKLDAVGRNGGGRCFSSGTVSEAYPCWMRTLSSAWPSDELYVSFWMRYPKFVLTDPTNENFKIFYPHWDGTSSYVHYAMSGPNLVYYSAMANGSLVAYSRWLTCTGMTDGKWHHYQFYVKFSEGLSRFWYDGTLMIDDTYGTGKWTNLVYYVSAPSIDAEEPGLFSRQIDDLEMWDGMP
jgi:hypothetical protein